MADVTLDARLRGTWAIVEVRDAVIPEGAVPTLAFDGGQVSGFSGCNTYRSSAQLAEDGSLSLGPAEVTRMACGSAAMDMEAQILGALQVIDRVEFEGADRIVLSAGGYVMLRATRR